MKIVFRTDASLTIGGGHVMRCLALAEALAARGANVAFVSAAVSPTMACKILEAGHVLLEIDSLDGSWPDPAEPDAQRRDAQRTLSAIGENGADTVVVDHYQLDRSWEEAVRPGFGNIVAIDDLCRTHDCDLLIDQTFGRSAADYRDRVPPRCRILTGALYATLRPEFAAMRAAALERRRTPPGTPRLLVAMGSTDFGGLTEQVARALVASGFGGEVDLVFGDARSPGLPATQALAREHELLTVHVESKDVARLMARADLAVGAAGVSSWERCCLGLPTVTMVVADNQDLVARNLGDARAIVIARTPREAALAVAAIVADAPRRLAMVAAAAAITDGLGAGRVAHAITDGGWTARRPLSAGEVTLRVCDTADAERLWLWRNDPLTRAVSLSRAPVPWPDHEAWLARSFTAAGRWLYIAEARGGPIGMVRFDALAGPEPAYEISINLDPKQRGGGAGKAVLAAACAAFLQSNGPARLDAAIHAANEASIRIFESTGFARAGPLGETGFLRYVRPMTDPAHPSRRASLDAS